MHLYEVKFRVGKQLGTMSIMVTARDSLSARQQALGELSWRYSGENIRILCVYKRG